MRDIPAQQQELRIKGLKIDDEPFASQFLKFVNYHRLSAYCVPFENNKKKFYSGITFETIAATYDFDRELRLVMLDAIERIEVAIRSVLVTYMSQEYNDDYWYGNMTLFQKHYKYDELMDKVRRIKEDHEKESGCNIANLPCWTALEGLSFGDLSKMFSHLKKVSDQKKISAYFDVQHENMESWLKSIAYIRNICAHHQRLWNRVLVIYKPSKVKSNSLPKNIIIDNDDRFYARMFITQVFMKIILPNSTWHIKLRDTINNAKNRGIPTEKMRLPPSWEADEFWRF